MVVTDQKLFVVTIDAWSKRTPELTEILNSQTWKDFRKAGHQVRQFDFSETDTDGRKISDKYREQIEANGGLPVVVIMDSAAKWLNQKPEDMRLPKTEEGIRQLIRRYSTRGLQPQ